MLENAERLNASFSVNINRDAKSRDSVIYKSTAAIINYYKQLDEFYG